MASDEPGGGTGTVESVEAAEASHGGAPAQRSPTQTNQPTGDHNGSVSNLDTGVRLAFDMGWTMAGLANDATADVTISGLARLLPTEHELPRDARARLDAVRLGCLGASLAAKVESNQEPLPTDDIGRLQESLIEPNWQAVQASLQELHLKLLGALACWARPVILAYELGRSLRDTVTMPVQASVSEQPPGTEDAPKDALTRALDRDRVAIIQEWLATLTPHFPADSCAVVKASLGRWSDYVAAALSDAVPGKLRAATDETQFVKNSALGLLKQGDLWLNLLVGTQSLDGMLTPEAYVAAGEEALSRSGRIIWSVVYHYWVAILIIVLAAVGLTAVSAEFLGGAGRVWTQIAIIAGGLGITAKGISSRVARLADAGERPIYRAEEIDAMAWAVTNLPSAKLSPRAVRYLRRSGVQKTSPLGRA